MMHQGLRPTAVAPNRDNAVLPGSGFPGNAEEFERSSAPNGGRDGASGASNFRKRISPEPELSNLYGI